MANILASNRPFNVDDFEILLQNRNDHAALNNNITRLVPQEVPRYQSERSANISDFIKMVSTIITKATKERNVIFEPDEGARPRVDQSYQINKPHIFYKVVSRRPYGELKPREREEVLEKDDGTVVRKGRVWGQRFECIIQFDIMAGDYVTANNIAETFEELMFNYTSYFKRNGVAEIIFDEHLTDRDYDMYRQEMSIRSLRYRVWLEKLHVAFDAGELDGIITE